MTAVLWFDGSVWSVDKDLGYERRDHAVGADLRWIAEVFEDLADSEVMAAAWCCETRPERLCAE